MSFFMSRTYVALGSPEKFMKLGDFNVVSKGEKLDVYYNLDVGDQRQRMFNVNNGTYKNLEKAHHSFHYSGQGHMKEEPGVDKHFLGYISDGSVLNSSSMDPLILGIESYFFDIAAGEGNYEQDTLFLSPPSELAQYSILWLWVPATYPQKIHSRYWHVNLWGRMDGYNSVQTAALHDMAVSLEMKTISTVNGWEIRALFLKSLLPAMIPGVILSHPKGVDQVCRSWTSTDVHLPFSQMLKFEAIKKKPILTTGRYQIPEKSRTPGVWIKQKEVVDGADSSFISR